MLPKLLHVQHARALSSWVGGLYTYMCTSQNRLYVRMYKLVRICMCVCVRVHVCVRVYVHVTL